MPSATAPSSNPRSDPPEDLGELRIGWLRSLAFEDQRHAHHFAPYVLVAHTDAEVDPDFPFSVRIPARDFGGPFPDIEDGGDAVEHLEPVILSVPIGVNEPRRHDEPSRVNHEAAGQRVRADGADDSGAHADAPDGVKSGLGVHHATVADHNVVRCG